MYSVSINVQKLVEQRPVVDDSLTHFFRASFVAMPPQRQCASGAIVLHDDRMIHGQVVRTLLEIFEWIASRGHHVRNELIGFAHGAFRVVDKARLNTPPFAGECIGLILRQLAQVETTDTISAFPENGVRTWLAHSLNSSFVLGTLCHSANNFPSCPNTNTQKSVAPAD